MKSKKLTLDNPMLLELFKQHCEDGWSPRTFCKYMVNDSHGYQKALKTNKEFAEINKKYTKRTKYLC